jgi:hypothetical protein
VDKKIGEFDVPTNCYECNAELVGPVCKVCNPTTMEPDAWWAEFIEHWAAQGADRAALNRAVVNFRNAQRSLSGALMTAK